MTATRQRIIEATLNLVAEQGISSVTMVAVAKAAGVARATLYNNYPDVPSILADAAEVHNEHAIEGLRRALSVSSGPADALEQLVRYVAAISAEGHTLVTHQGFPPEVRHRLDAFNRELQRQIHRLLDDGTADGVFRPDLDLDVAAVLLRHTLVGLSQLVADAPERAPSTVRSTTAILLAAIADRTETEP